jgi:hypothetical protein
MRSEPPRTNLDPSVHVYAHSAGVRDGWLKAVEQLADFDGGPVPERTQRDSIIS